jgi:hypothetical protein
MGKRPMGTEEHGFNIETELVSNYVRLCICEGVKPDDAFKELKRRLQAIKELNAKPKA